jgi:hypothetical protein
VCEAQERRKIDIFALRENTCGAKVRFFGVNLLKIELLRRRYHVENLSFTTKP